MLQTELTKTIDPANPPKVEYCIPTWLRDEQIKLAIERDIPRLEPHYELRPGPLACVGYGPSLNETWEQVKGFSQVMACSGATKFLVERGVVPQWHVEVDPRPHKVQLIGEPHSDITYLLGSTCHPKVFDHLAGSKVVLWHVFDAAEDALRTLPQGEWALTGGCSVGVRMLTLARFLGFTDLHIFGMDGSEGTSGKHAAAHPSQPKGYSLVTMHGRDFKTTSSMFAVARGIWHELDLMPDVKATFHGDGLIQHMAKFYTPNPIGKGKAIIGYSKPELISASYRDMNARLHRDNLAYGVGGGKHADTVLTLAKKLATTCVLDYGSGKGYLAKALPFPIWEYDPAIPEKALSPRPADLVVCTDVLEHVEPHLLLGVLDDLRRVVKQVGYFVIHTGPASKTLPDGRNTHLIQQGRQWWKNRLKHFFKVGMIKETGKELHVVVAPLDKPKKASLVAA